MNTKLETIMEFRKEADIAGFRVTDGIADYDRLCRIKTCMMKVAILASKITDDEISEEIEFAAAAFCHDVSLEHYKEMCSDITGDVLR